MKISVLYSTLIVSNLNESINFYRDILGFKEGYHVDLPIGQITIMESEDGACVELIEHPSFEIGMYSIGCDVDDLDNTLSILESKGCLPTGPIIKTSVGRQAFIKDPDGNRLCLIEHTEDYRNKYMKR